MWEGLKNSINDYILCRSLSRVISLWSGQQRRKWRSFSLDRHICGFRQNHSLWLCRSVLDYFIKMLYFDILVLQIYLIYNMSQISLCRQRGNMQTSQHFHRMRYISTIGHTNIAAARQTDTYTARTTYIQPDRPTHIQLDRPTHIQLEQLIFSQTDRHIYS